MNDKLECLKIALEYTKIWNSNNSPHYKNHKGIIEIAKDFYNFVKDN